MCVYIYDIYIYIFFKYIYIYMDRGGHTHVPEWHLAGVFDTLRGVSDTLRSVPDTLRGVFGHIHFPESHPLLDVLVRRSDCQRIWHI